MQLYVIAMVILVAGGMIPDALRKKSPQYFQKRRLAHLLTMYGFILFVVSTAVMIFGYAGSPSPGVWPLIWHLGALMLCAGGYWFWFAIRVDVAAEGNPWYRVVKADLFIMELLARYYAC